MQATNRRIARTSSVISHIKSIKTAGLEGMVSNKVQHLRKEEIDQSIATRLTGTIYNITGRFSTYSPSAVLEY